MSFPEIQNEQLESIRSYIIKTKVTHIHMHTEQEIRLESHHQKKHKTKSQLGTNRCPTAKIMKMMNMDTKLRFVASIALNEHLKSRNNNYVCVFTIESTSNKSTFISQTRKCYKITTTCKDEYLNSYKTSSVIQSSKGRSHNITVEQS